MKSVCRPNHSSHLIGRWFHPMNIWIMAVCGPNLIGAKYQSKHTPIVMAPSSSGGLIIIAPPYCILSLELDKKVWSPKFCMDSVTVSVLVEYEFVFHFLTNLQKVRQSCPLTSLSAYFRARDTVFVYFMMVTFYEYTNIMALNLPASKYLISKYKILYSPCPCCFLFLHGNIAQCTLYKVHAT